LLSTAFPQYVVAIEAIKNIAGLSFISRAVLEEYREFHIRRFTEEFAAPARASESVGQDN